MPSARTPGTRFFATAGLIVLLLQQKFAGYADARVRPDTGALLPAAPARVVRDGVDSVATRAALEQSISEFHVLWQRVWRESEERRASEPEARPLLRRRFAYQHCHHGNAELLRRLRGSLQSMRGLETIARPDTQYALVNSESSVFAVCPSWQLTAISTYAFDESGWRDAAILEPLRPNVRAARLALIRQLAVASVQSPSDGWISGQLVRFLIDQRDYDGALTSATSCKAAKWWCQALVGLARAERGETVPAERAYAAMRAAMPPGTRCAWTSLQQLMAASDSAAYANMDCRNRDALYETLWWLADPLYRDAGNARRVEQDSREVEIALRRATTQDERNHWDVKSGGDAVEETVLRYGWPTYAGWGLQSEDISHSSYLDALYSARAEPYTTFEYALGRVHLLPALDVVRHPLESKATDWKIVGEGDAGELIEGWWPREHYKPGRRLIQLPDGQTAMFRRQEQILVASAVALAHPSLQVDSLLIDMMLLTTTDAAHVDSVAAHSYVGGETAVLQGMISGTPAILAVEGKGLGLLRVDLRTRFAIAPPPPLSHMKRGDVAVSDPVLIDAGDAANPAIAGDSLIGRMLGSTELDARHRRVGLYWESYGVGAGDTVHLAVRIASDRDVGALRRLGMALNVASDPRSGLEVRWTEPDAQHFARTLSGPVPVTQRTIVLNLQQLDPGPYLLEVSVERPGTPIAQGRRRIVIRP